MARPLLVRLAERWYMGIGNGYWRSLEGEASQGRRALSERARHRVGSRLSVRLHRLLLQFPSCAAARHNPSSAPLFLLGPRNPFASPVVARLPAPCSSFARKGCVPSSRQRHDVHRQMLTSQGELCRVRRYRMARRVQVKRNEGGSVGEGVRCPVPVSSFFVSRPHGRPRHKRVPIWMKRGKEHLLRVHGVASCGAATTAVSNLGSIGRPSRTDVRSRSAGLKGMRVRGG